MVDKYETLLTAIELTTTDFSKNALLSGSSKKILVDVDILSRQLILLRRYFWQIRDIVNYLLNITTTTTTTITTIEEEEKHKEEIKFLKIIYDDIDQLMLMVDSHNNSVNSIRELYIANVSLQLNDTIKTLTIFSVILLPLTFLTSLYGMNGLDLNHFWNVPIGLGIVLIFMMIIMLSLLVFFKRKQTDFC